MKTIWKYELPLALATEFTLDMPVGAKPLTVGMQGDTLCMWAEVDTTKAVVPQSYHLYGTGHAMESSSEIRLNYVGTYHLNGGQFVFHLYSVAKTS